MTFSPGKLLRALTRRWLGPCAGADAIVKVTVRDKESRCVRVLDSERDLAAFRTLWAALVETDAGARYRRRGGPYYRLQIQLIGRGGRIENASWLYFPDGTVQLLAVLRAVWIAPLYRTPTPATFEALLRGDAQP